MINSTAMDNYGARHGNVRKVKNGTYRASYIRAIIMSGNQRVGFTLGLINSTDGSPDAADYNKLIDDTLQKIILYFGNNHFATDEFLHELTLFIRELCELYNNIKELPCMSRRINPTDAIRSISDWLLVVAETRNQFSEQLPSVEEADVGLINIMMLLLKHRIASI